MTRTAFRPKPKPELPAYDAAALVPTHKGAFMSEDGQTRYETVIGLSLTGVGKAFLVGAYQRDHGGYWRLRKTHEVPLDLSVEHLAARDLVRLVERARTKNWA